MIVLFVIAAVMMFVRRADLVDLRRQHRPAMAVRREHETRDEHKEMAAANRRMPPF
jgi:hypothetical protein